MPKIKTHKATAKRFKLTKKGKVMRLRGGHKGGRTHFRRRRSKSVKRGFDRALTLETEGDVKRVKTLAPYLKKKKRS